MPHSSFPLLFWTICAAGLLFVHAGVRAGEWQELDDCKLIPNESNDGDSFHVKHKGEEFIFRLYFVDAPETSELIPSRVSEQAEVFGVSRERVLEAGKEAADFTADTLRRPFTVRTKWQDAEGMSRLARNYALVETADGEDLGSLLAAAGYARSYGVAVSPPGGRSASDLREGYNRLAERAERSKRGAWGTEGSGTKFVHDGPQDVEDEERVQRPAENEGGEPGLIPGLPSMDSLSETLRIEAEPVTETP